jgi:hypothetical protein
VPTQPLPDRLTPLAAEAGLRAFYGDIHNHCALSYGHGTLEQALANAKQQLDFVSVTGHAYWPDMPVDLPEVAHIVDFHVKGFARLAKAWPGHFETLAAAQEDGAFTVFPGYEMHSCAHGDYTIMLRDIAAGPLVKADDPARLERALREAYGAGAMAFPHHIAYRTGARGVNWDSFRESLSPVVELVSMHGSSESSLTDRPFLHSMGPGDGPNTIHAGWNAGHVFGVLGNTDHHSGYPGSYGHGRGCAFAPENSPAAIWEALHARRVGALTGDNIHLFATMEGAAPGSLVAPGRDRRIRVEAVGGSFIDCIDVIRNGQVVDRVTPQMHPAPICPEDEGRDGGDRLETLLTLELGWGGRGRHHDWRGSLRLAGGRIEALETRFRGAEIVSPLDGEHDDSGGERAWLEDGALRFEVRAHANPNNVTPATQALTLRVSLEPGAEIHAELSGRELRFPAARLLEGALSGNIGPIDTPAFRFHPLPRPADWQWQGTLNAGDLAPGDWASLRLRQRNQQYAWSSAFFCR